MRVVFDTNVLVAAFLTEGLCSVLLNRASRGEFELLICPKILEEFERVLKKKVKLPYDLAQDVLNLILEVSKVVQSTRVVQAVCRDEDDNNILACALSTGANYLISGDKDLLEIGSIERLKILSPREFEILFED